jgi:Ca2+-binding RTX toxin-like protein
LTDILGTSGDDRIDGTEGDDRIFAGAGNDTIFAYGGNDEVNGEEGRDYIVGGTGSDTLDGGADSDEIYGLEGDDTLRGGSGDDILRAGTGADLVEGGDGADFIEGDGAVSLPGDGNDQLSGGAGNDTIRGAGGDDIIVGGADADTLYGGAGRDHVDGGDGDDFLTGFGEEGYGVDVDADVLVGGLGNDLFIAGYGDAVDGGAGIDTLSLNFFSGAAAGVVADLRQLAVGIEIGGAMLTGIEYVGSLSLTNFDDDVIAGEVKPGTDGILIDGWGGNDRITDTAGTDLIYGGDGDDELHGGRGYNPSVFPSGDRLYGEAGNDRIFIDGPDGATASGGAGNDQIQGGAGRDDISGDDGDDVLRGGANDDGIVGGTGNDTLYGDDGNDILNGGDGNDLLIGGAGDDTLRGGAGSDIYFVESAYDQVTEALGGGYDIVYSSVSWSLRAGQEVEALLADNAASTASLDLRGNGYGQIIAGNAGSNWLLGGGGADTLVGRTGNDVYVINDTNAQVFEFAGEGYDIVYASVNWSIGAGYEVEALIAENAASTAAISLVGNELAQIIAGNAGSNWLNGRGGADTLVGRAGDDFYTIGATAAQVFETAGEGYDIVYSSVDWSIATGQEIEALIADDASSTAPISLVGNELAQIIAGNAGSNWLNGFGGADTLIGRGGNDFYVVANSQATVSEAVGEGTDYVYSSVDYGLLAGQEIEALLANDAASTAALSFTGNEFAQLLAGNDGANRIDGSAGSDSLIGRGGADSFAFTTALGASNFDTIFDFEVVTDQILLDDAVFTGLGLGALAAGAFRLGSTAQDADDRILYDSQTGALSFDADGVGGAAAVQFATVTAGLGITASEFTVI